MNSRMSWMLLGAAVMALGAGCGQPAFDGDGQQSPIQGCSSLDGDVLSYDNEPRLRELLNGRWLFCEGARRLFRDDQAGLELDTTHGLWWALVRSQGGEIVRATRGFDMKGTFTIQNTAACCGGNGYPPTYQIDLYGEGANALWYPMRFPDFLDSPRKVIFHRTAESSRQIFLRIP